MRRSACLVVVLMQNLISALTSCNHLAEEEKFEYNLKLKIKLSDWLLADTCPQQPIIALYFEFENELKFITSGSGRFALIAFLLPRGVVVSVLCLFLSVSVSECGISCLYLLFLIEF